MKQLVCSEITPVATVPPKLEFHCELTGDQMFA